jgi:putative ABC transport system permease protein
MLALLRTFSWQELRHHPWRSAAAVVAVMLGVALAFSVHLINASALSEFSSAVRSVNGQPDVELRAASGTMDEGLYARVAAHSAVQMASPVLEISTYALDAQGQKKPLKVLGVDALVVASSAPSLMPLPAKQLAKQAAQPDDADRFALFAPDAVFLNTVAADAFKGSTLQVLTGLRSATLKVAGSMNAAGAPLAVMDLGAAQDLFGKQGSITRIDVRLRPGADRTALLRDLVLPASVLAQEPGDSAQRVSNLSRAYRVNMTVLALVALFTGAFLVFSVLSLSVAKRAQQFALLGVLGLTARQRLQLVLVESALLGTVGSALGLALGTALAQLALRMLGGDLGGGYFAGVAPALQFSTVAASVYGALGVLAAVVGGWWPAQAASGLPLAQSLKGLGQHFGKPLPLRYAIVLVAACALFVWAPPLFGIPIAAYVAIGLLLVGGIALLPWLVAVLYDRLAPHIAHRVLPMLAVERARRVRQAAAVAISGVVAALSLAVALTVMVASFRTSVTHWLDVVLPAPLYMRAATSVATADVLYFSPEFVQATAQLPGVQRVAGVRTVPLQLDAAQPAVMLVARNIDDAAQTLPLVSGPVHAANGVPADAVPIYVSEAMVDLYGARLGGIFKLNMPLGQQNRAWAATNSIATINSTTYYIAGVWRDYARQFGTIAIDQRDYVRISGDTRVNDLSLWLHEGAQASAVMDVVRALAVQTYGTGADALLEFASADEIRAVTLKIFDRSFAVTYWLQAVAIAIGLFGVAASFSAQVLARRKEFGLLAHLGLTRRQILQVVAGEGAAWTAIGSIAGCALGLMVSGILVHVVNPQSFHWSMDLTVPWLRLAWLCAAVVAAGTVTAWLAGRAAAGHDAVLAVKEDW